MGLFKKRGKKGMGIEMSAWWIIALVVLAIMLIAFFVLKERGVNAVEFIKNLFRLRA